MGGGLTGRAGDESGVECSQAERLQAPPLQDRSSQPLPTPISPQVCLLPASASSTPSSPPTHRRPRQQCALVLSLVPPLAASLISRSTPSCRHPDQQGVAPLANPPTTLPYCVPVFDVLCPALACGVTGPACTHTEPHPAPFPPLNLPHPSLPPPRLLPSPRRPPSLHAPPPLRSPASPSPSPLLTPALPTRPQTPPTDHAQESRLARGPLPVRGALHLLPDRHVSKPWARRLLHLGASRSTVAPPLTSPPPLPPLPRFNLLHPVLLWGWAPAVVLLGMNAEPKPSWFDLIDVIGI